MKSTYDGEFRKSSDSLRHVVSYPRARSNSAFWTIRRDRKLFIQTVMDDARHMIDLYRLRQRLLGEPIPSDYGKTAGMTLPEEST